MNSKSCLSVYCAKEYVQDKKKCFFKVGECRSGADYRQKVILKINDMKKIIKLSLAILSIALFACNNEKSDAPVMDESLAEKSAAITVTEVELEAATSESNYEVEFFANAEGILTHWWRIGKHFKWNQKLRYRINHCPEVTVEEGENDGYPKVITLDYGEGTELANGKVLSGEIIIEISAPRSSQNYKREVTYSNFGIDGLTVTGTSEIIIDKVDEHFRKIASDLTFVKSDEFEMNRKSERIWQWVAGVDTEEDQTDDIFTIIGEVEATINWEDGTSETYKKEITTPLKRIAGCKYIVEGVVEVRIGDELVSILDYGYSESEEECDQYAELKTGEGTEIIDLSERKRKSKQNQNGNKGQNGNG